MFETVTVTVDTVYETVTENLFSMLKHSSKKVKKY